MFPHACLIKRSIIHSINFGDVLAVKARAGKVSGGRTWQHQRLKLQSTVSSDAHSALSVLNQLFSALFSSGSQIIIMRYTLFLHHIPCSEKTF
jgi:hypothetical protein